MHTDYAIERTEYARNMRQKAEYAKNEKQKLACLALANRAWSSQCNCGAGHDHAGSGYCGY